MISKRHKVVVISFCSLTLYSIFQSSSAELRFCLPSHGPQRMKDTDCPGGFIFKEPIVNPDCKFYAKTGNHEGKVLTAPTDICVEGTDRIIENEGDDLDDIPNLTYFLWEEMDDVNDTKGAFHPENVCYDECLPEWEDPYFIADEEPIDDHFDESTVPVDVQEELKNFNKGMFLRLLLDDDIEDDFPPPVPYTVPPDVMDSGAYPMTVSNDPNFPESAEKTPPDKVEKREAGNSTAPVTLPARIKIKMFDYLVPGHSFFQRVLHDSSQLNVIKLLSKSMKIIIGACTPFLNDEFFEQVLKGMMYIAEKMEHSFLDVAQDLYTKISNILDHCGLRRHQEFTLNGSICVDRSIVDGVHFTKAQEYWPHRLQGWSYRWGRWHPILDAAWSVIDFVHSFCYESFTQDLMMLHVFEMSLEGLFPEKMQWLWRTVPIVKSDNFWNNLMQTYDLNITMRNLDACQQGALKSSPFHDRLPRPFLTLTELAKPPSPPAAHAAVKKGWNKTMDKYWERYESLGGFAKLSEPFGKCFVDGHIEVQKDMVDELKQKCT